MAAVAKGVEIRGTVREVNGKRVVVSLEGENLPAEGDKTEIYFKLAGTEDEVSVATGKVAKVDGDAVQVNIENATGDVEKGQLARITSNSPQKRSAAAAATSTSVTPASTKQSATVGEAKTAWDFSAGDNQGVRSEATDIVDAKRWGLKGGSHMRFLTGGKSWMAASFNYSAPSTGGGQMELVVRHLSSSPDGTRVGYSPVRITLNGTSLFEGSPRSKDFVEDRFDTHAALHEGENVLRWEFQQGATTHYWLKSFAIRNQMKK